MRSSVYHGFAIQAEESIEKLKQKLLQLFVPQQLWLLGLATHQRRIESLFSLHGISKRSIGHYYLLALVQKRKEQSLNAIQDKIENNLQHFVPVTAIVLDVDQFTQWLLEGHPFASAVYEKGFLIFQNEEKELPSPALVKKEQLREEKEAAYIRTKLKIEGFLAAADLHRIRKEYKLSAFMLHQAAEQALRTMMFINTGLTINTHNIDKLIRYCSMFCYQLPDIFPGNNENEKKLFSLLNKAYIDTRYKDCYSIAFEELAALIEKVKMIKQLFENYKSMTDENL